MEVVSGDNWSYKTCKAPVKLSPPTDPTPSVLQDGFALPVAQPTGQSNEGKLNKEIHSNGNILVPANSGPPGKWPLKRRDTYRNIHVPSSRRQTTKPRYKMRQKSRQTAKKTEQYRKHKCYKDHPKSRLHKHRVTP